MLEAEIMRLGKSITLEWTQDENLESSSADDVSRSQEDMSFPIVLMILMVKGLNQDF